MDIIVSKRKSDFLAQLNLSETTLRNYKVALNSALLKEMLFKVCDGKQLFEITDLDLLWELYSKINLHPRNISNHRTYSAVVMKYIRFLNHGEKYGRRIDYNKPKGKRK
jgi:hypothetical protein